MVRSRVMNSISRQDSKVDHISWYEIIKSGGRKPRKRGLKPCRGRGTFYKDHPMITCIHQKRRNGMKYFDVPIQQSLLDDIVCSRVQYGSTIHIYRWIWSIWPIGWTWIHTQKYQSFTKERICKWYCTCINNCECRSNLYQLWVRKFMGVNKYNLQTYSKTLEFIHNNRTKAREERFMEILCN